MPTFVGIIFGEEAIHIEKVRFGFGVANNISWSQGLNSAVERPSSAKVLYGVKSQMQQYQGIAAVSYAVSESFRLGFSLAVPYTWVSDNGQLNASLNQGVSTTSTFRTVNFSGYNFHLLPKAGLQWDALGWLSLGAVVAPPGLRVIQGGDLTIQALGTTNSATSSVSEQQSFRDTTPRSSTSSRRRSPAASRCTSPRWTWSWMCTGLSQPGPTTSSSRRRRSSPPPRSSAPPRRR